MSAGDDAKRQVVQLVRDGHRAFAGLNGGVEVPHQPVVLAQECRDLPEPSLVAELGGLHARTFWR